jgi:hypothetical protein
MRVPSPDWSRRLARSRGRRISSLSVASLPHHPGDKAPDFELPGTGGNFRLSAQRGRPVVLLFYPRDESRVCTSQLCF